MAIEALGGAVEFHEGADLDFPDLLSDVGRVVPTTSSLSISCLRSVAFDGSDGILSTNTLCYRLSLADSAFACTRIGISVSAFCQSVRKS